MEFVLTAGNIPDDQIQNVVKANFRQGAAAVPSIARPTLTGADLIALLANPVADMSRLPRFIATANAHSTRLEHLRMLKLLKTMPPQWTSKPLGIAITGFLEDLSSQSTTASANSSGTRTKKQWAPTTTFKYMCSAQGALRLLPLYRTNTYSVPLRFDEFWNLAMKGARIAAIQHAPNQPIPATYELVDQAIKSCKAGPYSAQIRIILMLGWSTAARLGCVRQLQRQDFLIKEREIHITFRRGKGVIARKTAYTVTTTIANPIWREELVSYLASKQKWLFAKNLNVTHLRSALSAVGLEQRSLRRGALQAMAVLGTSPDILMNFSGHSSVLTLNRYLDFGKKRHDLNTAAVTASDALWTTSH
eukprot:GILI01009744.1.p1 GENE.GILI01009744.1~~GILI01009744.1.p1  ORF type:complete len:415 (+),score=80.13 GILI01009744.1:161-1246(+)